MSETNWARLFGTPERAAETLYEVCGGDFEEECPMDTCPMAEHDDKSAFVNCKLRNGASAWLSEEADDD